MDLSKISESLPQIPRAAWESLPPSTQRSVLDASGQLGVIAVKVATHGADSLSKDERDYAEAAAANLAAIGLSKKTALDLLEAVAETVLKLAVGTLRG